jgi:hypothetical protein
VSLTLTPDELRELTDARRRDAQERALGSLGIPFGKRPDGSIVVLRSAVEGRFGAGSTIAPPRRTPQLQP